MKYNVGDLVIFNNRDYHQIYTGIITDIVKHKDWYGGGYYIFHWEYAENFSRIKDDTKVGFSLLTDWVKNKEAIIYSVVK